MSCAIGLFAGAFLGGESHILHSPHHPVTHTQTYCQRRRAHLISNAPLAQPSSIAPLGHVWGEGSPRGRHFDGSLRPVPAGINRLPDP